jgi:hypothetical protein
VIPILLPDSPSFDGVRTSPTIPQGAIEILRATAGIMLMLFRIISTRKVVFTNMEENMIRACVLQLLAAAEVFAIRHFQINASAFKGEPRV